MTTPGSLAEQWNKRVPPGARAWLRKTGRALGTPVGSVLFAFLLGGIVVLISGGDPVLAYRDLACGGLGLFCSGNVYPALNISETIVFTIPLILAGLSVAIGFRAGLFNIGAEGQLIMGAIATTVVGIKLATWPAFVLLPLVLLAGTLAGAVWGGIVGVLRAFTGAHEVVTTIMLNYVAQFFLVYLIVGGPLELRGQSSATASIGQGAQLPTLVPANSTFLGLAGSVYRAHSGIFIALAAAVVFSLLLKRTALGYEIRAVGQSQRAARYAGISVRRTMIISMLLAGAFAGLAGAVQIAGLRHNLTDIYGADTTGFDAIAVALLGQNAAIGVVLSAVLFAMLHVGGQFMQSDANVSANLVDILQALILFSIAANFLRGLRIRMPKFAARPPLASAVDTGPPGGQLPPPADLLPATGDRPSAPGESV